jgi:hypothetical protein
MRIYLRAFDKLKTEIERRAQRAAWSHAITQGTTPIHQIWKFCICI